MGNIFTIFVYCINFRRRGFHHSHTWLRRLLNEYKFFFRQNCFFVFGNTNTNWFHVHNHDQSARHQGAIYEIYWEGIQYNIIDTTSYMLGNLQSVFLPAKAKRFQKKYKKHAARLSTHQSQLLVSSLLYLIIVYLYIDTLI